MSDTRPAAPRSAFLLRMDVQREERIRLRYELQDLRSGELHRFDSLAALTRFLRRCDAATPTTTPKLPPVSAAPVPGPPARKRK